MNYEDKKLLIENLGAMLPHGVMMNITLSDEKEGIARLTKIDEYGNCTLDIPSISNTFIIGENTKPYLRKLSGLTDEEKNDIIRLLKNETFLPNFKNPDKNELLWFITKSSITLVNWFIENKFDLGAFIYKGLALEAKDGMYNSITKLIEM